MNPDQRQSTPLRRRIRQWSLIVTVVILTIQQGCQSTSQMTHFPPANRLTLRTEPVPPANRTSPKSNAASNPVGLVGFQQQDGESEKIGLLDGPAEDPKSSTESNFDDAEVPPTADDDTDRESLVLEVDDSDPPQPSAADEFESAATNPNALSLQRILQSVADCYPEIEIAIGEIETANGKILASWGEFDRVFSAHSISQPLGFYQTYRNGVGLSRPLFGGGEVYGTYRIGDGNFEPWYGERETNEGGELKAGFSIPLLKDRAIDERRAKLYASGFNRDQVESNVDTRLLQFQRFATQAYWDWVSSGQLVRIQEQLLTLAETRVGQIKTRIEEGDLAEISRIDNDRFIAKRNNDLIKARRSLEKAAIKLSMFWRDSNCDPVIPEKVSLPNVFPNAFSIEAAQLAADIETALNVRPELQELIASRKAACIDRQYGQNLTLPKIDIKGFAGQDVGGATSSKGDKTPFELQLGVLAEVPLERRQGLGKIRAAQGKLTQIDAKTRFVSDKIRAEVQDAASAVNAAYEQIEQSQDNVRLARKSLELGRLSFREGDIDLIALNIYETSVADAELQLLDAQFKYFFYRAIYQTAIKNSF